MSCEHRLSIDFTLRSNVLEPPYATHRALFAGFCRLLVVELAGGKDGITGIVLRSTRGRSGWQPG